MLQSDTVEEVSQSLPNERHSICNTLVPFFSLHFLFPVNLLLWGKNKTKQNPFFPAVVSMVSLLIQMIKPKTWESFLIAAFL